MPYNAREVIRGAGQHSDVNVASLYFYLRNILYNELKAQKYFYERK